MPLQVIGLFPFLSADFTSAKQRFLRIMAEWHEQVALLGGALGRLPQRLQDYFIRSLGGGARCWDEAHDWCRGCAYDAAAVAACYQVTIQMACVGGLLAVLYCALGEVATCTCSTCSTC